MSERTVVIGVGNPWRGDDGVGLEVARRLAPVAPGGVGVLEHEGDQSGLLEKWRGADVAVVVDAASAGSRPGTIHRFDATTMSLPTRLLRSSTHAFGVADAVELGRVLDRLPGTLLVYAIEGSSFAAGEGLTPEVEQAVGEVVDELIDPRGSPLSSAIGSSRASQ